MWRRPKVWRAVRTTERDVGELAGCARWLAVLCVVVSDSGGCVMR